MKNHDFWRHVENFVLGKGFYIALALCVAAIGVSGYLLYDTMNKPDGTPEPVGGHAEVKLPDRQPAPVLPSPAPQPSKPAQPDKPVKPAKPAEPVEGKDKEPAGDKKDQAQTETVVYTWPVKGAVIRDYSMETLLPDPTLGDWRTHRGLDIAAAAGANVLAMGRGKVSEVYDDGLMGTTVVVEHPDGVRSVYCGLAQDPPVAAGDRVETGAVIGTVGGTAIAESGMESHIHVETWRAGEPTDPTFYLPLR